MTLPLERAPRGRTREALVRVAGRLLAEEGPDAVTTRAVAAAAGVQAPALYRLFGDKEGLLAAVAEQGFADYLATKPGGDPDADPVAALRAGWELHIGFGLDNPALFRLMHAAPRSERLRALIAAGADVLRGRVHRIALAGRLRVPERRAVDLLHATATGVVLGQLERGEDERDPGLPDEAWSAVAAAILDDGAAPTPGPAAAAAVALRAALPDVPALTDGERRLLAEWLDRVAADRPPSAGSGTVLP